LIQGRLCIFFIAGDIQQRELETHLFVQDMAITGPEVVHMHILCKNKLVVSTTEWIVWLHTSLKDMQWLWEVYFGWKI